jgi:hypothetical protein
MHGECNVKFSYLCLRSFVTTRKESQFSGMLRCLLFKVTSTHLYAQFFAPEANYAVVVCDRGASKRAGCS